MRLTALAYADVRIWRHRPRATAPDLTAGAAYEVCGVTGGVSEGGGTGFGACASLPCPSAGAGPGPSLARAVTVIMRSAMSSAACSGPPGPFSKCALATSTSTIARFVGSMFDLLMVRTGNDQARRAFSAIQRRAS